MTIECCYRYCFIYYPSSCYFIRESNPSSVASHRRPPREDLDLEAQLYPPCPRPSPGAHWKQLSRYFPHFVVAVQVPHQAGKMSIILELKD